MRRRTFLTGAAAGAMMLSACRLPRPNVATTDEDARLDALLDRFVEEMLRESPESATSLGLDVGPHAALRGRLNGRSAATFGVNHEQCVARLRELGRFDRNHLSDSARSSYDAVRYAHQLVADGGRFGYGSHSLRDTLTQTATPYVVSQMTGAFFEVPQLLAGEHPLDGSADADAYLSRLQHFAVALDDETARLREDRAKGVIPPAFVLDTVSTQMAAVLAAGSSASTLVRSLAERAAAKSIAGAPAGRAAQLVEQAVFPALARQLAQIRVLREAATATAGVGALPEAQAYYAWLLQVATTTTLSADEIHRRGEERSAQITARMDTLLRSLGLAQGSVGERMAALGSDPRQQFPDDDRGREQALAYVRELVHKARSQLSGISALDLRARLRVERVPPEIELGAAGAYVLPGPLDGSRDSIYFLNLRTTSTWPKWTLPTLTYHETLPGHVWQEALGIEQRLWHPIRSLVKFNVYSEGWGLYAEQLMDELGFHDDDPAGRLGYLQAQLLRATRLVVDTGLHAQGWSRERAIARMVQATGRPREAMQGEVDRYCVKPGQACGYEIGRAQIVSLREAAQRASGAAFALRDFNDCVLTTGNVPMDVLAEVTARRFAPAAGP